MKKRLVALLLVLALLVPCTLASAATWYRLKSSVKLRYLPDYDTRILDSYRTDWALTIGKTVNSNWAYITFSNGRSGYVERSALVRGKSFSAWVTKNGTELRHGPDYSFATLSYLDRGAKVTVLTWGSNYAFVKTSSGSYGYVANSVLSKKKVSPASSSTKKSGSYTAWVTSKGGPVGLRNAPSGSNNAVFAQYWPGKKITVLEYGSQFCYVSIDGQKGYMRTKYISKYEPAPIPPDPNPAPVIYPPYTTTARSSGGSSPRLYQGEGLGWASVKLAEGTTVNVTAKGKDPYWVKVQLNDGRKGYMPLKFLN